MKPRIALLLGDPNGVGPELAARLLAMPEVRERADVVTIGPPAVWQAAQDVAGQRFDPLEIIDIAREEPSPGSLSFLPLAGFEASDITVGRATQKAGALALQSLAFVARALQDGHIDGAMFAPLNKQAMRMAGLKQEDELEYVAERIGFHGPCCELNVVDGLWSSRVTSHIPLAKVAENLTGDAICDAAHVIDNALKMSGLARPRILACALNPHAGDGGTMGREEIDVIGPAIERLRREGLDIHGPHPADTAFLTAKRQGYDAVLTMYHDQGQIALKTMGFERGVTVMGGLPYPIATPAQGTAFDIAGKGVANPEAIRRAFHIVADMAASRARHHALA
ncbi:MAG: 4-hydroxythreonine-4-phosphate dehydrogenase PdxA [Gammaproteobacteria bacterium]